jgi:hypothetical protein
MQRILDYMHNNPMQRNLVESVDLWRWSSWLRYHRPDLPADPELPLVTVLQI